MGRRGLPTAAPPDVRGLDEVMLREVRRSAAARSILFFAATYLRDENDEPFRFKDFHVEMLELAASEAPEDIEAVFLVPAANGKTTILSHIYPLYLLCRDPNVRIALIGKTYEDAKARLRAIKRQLETNELLIRDFGPFLSPRWTDDEIEVAGRTSKSKDPTIKIFGSGMSVFGWRATHVVCDDIVTIQNSGFNVRDETRRALRDNYMQGIRKMGGPGTKVRIRWAQTVVDLRDLVHEVADLRTHADSEMRWTTPHGVQVLRRRALNEETGEVLWPERYTREDLEKERSADVVAFLRRMQNRCVEPELMTFQREWVYGNGVELRGCLDRDRVFGQRPLGLATTTTVIGFDPNYGLSDSAKYCGVVVLDFDRTAKDPKPYFVRELHQFRAKLEDQVRFLIDLYDRVHASAVCIEINAANRWLTEVRAFEDATKRGADSMRVVKYMTTGPSKRDPETGIPALAESVKGGLVRLPYADEFSVAESEKLITELLTHPMGNTSDILMGLWFAMIAARELQPRPLRVVRRELPSWAQGFRMGPPAGGRPVVMH